MRTGSMYFHTSIFISRWEKKGPRSYHSHSNPKFHIYKNPGHKARMDFVRNEPEGAYFVESSLLYPGRINDVIDVN